MSLPAQSSRYPPGNGQTRWMDVSEFLLDQVPSDLAIGEMIHGPDFSLFEVMTALEIMDPKMDSGCAPLVKSLEERVRDGSLPVIRDLDNASNTAFQQPTPECSDGSNAVNGNQEDVRQKAQSHCEVFNFTTRQVIDLMDALLCAEMTWHQGFHLAQTLLTCLYLHDIDGLVQHRFLHPYMTLLMKTVDSVRYSVIRAQIREEEEFSVTTFGFHLGEIYDDREALSNITSAIDELSSRIEVLHTLLLTTNDGPHQQSYTWTLLGEQSTSNSQPDWNQELLLCEALHSRLCFTKAFYQTNTYIGERAPLEMFDDVLSGIGKTREQIHLLRQNYARLHSISGPPANITAGIPGFEPNVMQLINVAVPLKKVEFLSFEKSLQQVEEYLSHLSLVCRLRENYKSLHSLLLFFQEISTERMGIPARSRLFTSLMSGGRVLGVISMTKLFLEYVAQFTERHEPHKDILSRISSNSKHKTRIHSSSEESSNAPLPPPVEQQSINPSEPKKMATLEELDHEFVIWCDSISKLIVQLFQAYCVNKSRLRRKLKHAIPQWGDLEIKAEEIDIGYSECFYQRRKQQSVSSSGGKKHKPPPESEQPQSPIFVLSYVALDFLLKIMRQFLVLGFDLELFHHSEYTAVFWYMECLSGYSISVHNYLSQMPNSAEHSKKKNRKPKQTQAQPETPTIVFATPEIRNEALTVEIETIMSRALCRFLKGLQKSGHYAGELTPFPFGTRQLRFERRFSPFYVLRQPVPVSFDEYVSYSETPQLSADDMLANAEEQFSMCKSLIERELREQESQPGGATTARFLQYLVSMMKIANGNSVSVKLVRMQLARAHALAPPTSSTTIPTTPNLPQFDVTYSRSFPVIKMKIL